MVDTVETQAQAETAEVGEAVFTTYTDPAGMIYGPNGIAAGPDGNIWFTSRTNHRIGRIAPQGQITTWGHPDISLPHEIVAGPDGNLWFTSSGNSRIGRITPQGDFSFFQPENITDWGQPWGITVGPDDNLWFTTRGVKRTLVRLTTDGQMTVFPIPSLDVFQGVLTPNMITGGPDNALWVTGNGNGLLRMTTAGEFSGRLAKFPKDVEFDSSGRLWMPASDLNAPVKVQRLTPPLPGTLTTFDAPGVPGAAHRITAGPDGRMWFTVPSLREVWRMDLNGQVAARFEAPEALVPTGAIGGGGIRNLTFGPDGNLWFVAENGSDINLIGRLQVGSELSGTVTDEVTGEPVADAWVAAVPTAGGSPVGTTTGSDGSYSLSVLTGDYLVEFVAPGLGHRGEWYPDRALSDVGHAERVRVDLDGVSVDAALAPTTAAATGTLSNSAGGPLAGGWVATAGVDGVAATTTAPDGAWVIEGLAAGPRLFVFVDPTGAHLPEFYNDRRGAPPDLVNLTAGTSTDLDAALTSAPAPGSATTLSGTVTDDATSDPVPGAWVAVVDAASYQFVAGTSAGVDGTYSLGLPAGSYRVEVIDPAGALGGEWHADAPLGDPAAATSVATTPGPATIVDVALTPATGSIEGSVTVEGGDPLAGAWVAAVNANTGGFAGGAITGGDGGYDLDDLVPGNYLLVFFDPTAGHGFEWHDNTAVVTSATPVTVTPTNPYRTINAMLQPSP